MPTALLCHPTTACAAIDAIEASADFAADGGVDLRYRLRGDLAGLRLPSAQPPGPADGLWQTTCCEAFMATVDGPDYREFNFSPSGQWAAYRFNNYRQRDDAFVAPAAPRFAVQYDADALTLAVHLAPALLPAGPDLRLGLSCVVEAADGGKSYWALAHAAERPDFHLPQSFSLLLKARS